MNSICQKLKEEYDKISVKISETAGFLSKSGVAENFEEKNSLMDKAEETMNSLSLEISGFRETIFPKILETEWTNPGNGQKEKINIDIEKEIDFFEDFYERHRIKSNLKPGDEFRNMVFEKEKFKKIWGQNYRKIKKEIEKYGYNTVLLVPENIPQGNTTISWLMREENPMVLGSSHESPGRNEKNKILLTKKSLTPENDFLYSKTQGKGPEEISGLTNEKCNEKIKQNEPLPVNFSFNLPRKKAKHWFIPRKLCVEAEGLSLEEYGILSKTIEEKTGEKIDLGFDCFLPKPPYWTRDRETPIFTITNNVARSNQTYVSNYGFEMRTEKKFYTRFGKSFYEKDKKQAG